jgi:hypothetical protein
MLDELASNKMNTDLWGWSNGIELFKYCGKWHNAYALERRRLVEIWRNEKEQEGVFLVGLTFL